jgi:hypothetical protein
MRQVPEDVYRGGDPWRLACIARESFMRRNRAGWGSLSDRTHHHTHESSAGMVPEEERLCVIAYA